VPQEVELNGNQNFSGKVLVDNDTEGIEITFPCRLLSGNKYLLGKYKWFKVR